MELWPVTIMEKMMTNKKEDEPFILWRLHSGNSSFWWDNWLGNGHLASFRHHEAWHVLRNQKPILLTNKLTWYKKLPFKWSFFLWRELRNKLPTDDRTAKFGHPTVTKYVWCIKSSAETVDHIFSTGHFAKAIWKIYAAPTAFKLILSLSEY
ncbi:PREDICTED: uncharacterized protein LOC109234688 [Nicotiana attenuata]|uniref:uncharacterized protein LOC109234688 n=1 Tax=Nicotiana attenuata TaxID=49451 RepID=UPI000905AE3B|nr:PREDICTED: uncharacterized protein LOC109234688 [Nicotiana attenuata]